MTSAVIDRSVTAQRRQQRGVGLVCVAHFFSHFYLILLAPLFPLLAEYFNVGYTQIGFALAVFSVCSALTQAPMGFLVDRYGAVGILIGGVALQGFAFGVIGTSESFVFFLFLMALAGVANSVYHPADYSILNAIVDPQYMGRVFSYHTAAGLFGEAIAPASVLLLGAVFGWKIALAFCGAAGIAVALGLLLQRSTLLGFDQPADTSIVANGAPWALLFSAPILMGLLFFVGISLLTRGVTGFGVSALHVGHGLTNELAGWLISAWLICSPVGVLLGGWVADHNKNHAAFVAGCFALIALCIFSVIYVAPNVWWCAVFFAIGGLCAGAVSPSRDMLIRSITPAGQTGKVFGFVSTGFNVGGIVAPPVFGYLLDHGQSNGVFIIAALAAALSIFTVLGTQKLGRAADHRH